MSDEIKFEWFEFECEWHVLLDLSTCHWETEPDGTELVWSGATE